jgi:hypothetical protein
MKRRFALGGLALVIIGCAVVQAQDTSQSQANAKKSDVTQAVTPLRVQVVFTEFDGDKKISSLPYTLSVNADERRANPTSQVRNGVRIPILQDKDKFTYLDVGTNIDCSAMLQDDGRFKLQMQVERSAVSSDSTGSSSNPMVRTFRANMNPVLKDGQTAESIVSTDPLNGHVYHVSVTLTVLK